jgi:chromosome segregation ATPase
LKPNAHKPKTAIEESFPDVDFHTEIAGLLSDIVSRARSAQSDNMEERLRAYEAIVARTGQVLRWINTRTKLKLQPEDPRLGELSSENADLREKLNTLVKQATEIRRENRALKARLKDPNASAKELAALILGLRADASEKGIKAAYRSKAKITHPDVGGDDDIFKGVTEAMLLLMRGVK